MTTRSHWFLAVCATVALGAGDAAADKASAAARAFGEAQQALMENDFERAADRFELANSILPSKEALRGAVRARHQTGHLARAAMLAEQLLAQHFSDPASSKVATDVLAEAKGKFGRVTILCAAPCTISVNSRAMNVTAAQRHVLYLPAGALSIEASFGTDLTAKRAVQSKLGADAQLSIERPPRLAVTSPATGSSAAKSAKPRARAPRIVPLIGASLTVALAGVATWSSIDTRSAHDDYAANPTEAAFDDGRSKQLRTNILWGSVAAVGVATAVTAVFFTNWKDKKKSPREGRLGVIPSKTDVMFVFAKPL